MVYQPSHASLSRFSEIQSEGDFKGSSSVTSAFKILGILSLFFFNYTFSETRRFSYHSPLLKTLVSYTVFLPSSYSKGVPKQRFPVVYLLHCAGCRASDWSSEHYEARVDVLIDSSSLIVVALDDNNTLSWWMDSPKIETSQWSSYLILELKPKIDSQFTTLSARASTGLAGHSMGGFGAMHNLITHPDIFSAAYSFKGALDLKPYPNEWGLSRLLGSQSSHLENWRNVNIVGNACSLRGKDVNIRFYSGPNDWFYDSAKKLHRELDSCGVEHQFIINTEDHYNVPRESMLGALRFFDSTLLHQAVSPNSIPRDFKKKAKNFSFDKQVKNHELSGKTDRGIVLAYQGEYLRLYKNFDIAWGLGMKAKSLQDPLGRYHLIH